MYHKRNIGVNEMNRIKEIRKQKGITVTRLAEMIGVPQGSLTAYENNKRIPRNEEFWTEVAEALEVSVPYLRGLSEEDDLNKEFQVQPTTYISEIYNPFEMRDAGILWKVSILNETTRELLFTGLGKNAGKSVTVKYFSGDKRWEQIIAENNLEVEETYFDETASDTPVETFWYQSFPKVDGKHFVITELKDGNE
jgi:transcriptional regulator with XRE-family HTH domain